MHESRGAPGVVARPRRRAGGPRRGGRRTRDRPRPARIGNGRRRASRRRDRGSRRLVQRAERQPQQRVGLLLELRMGDEVDERVDVVGEQHRAVGRRPRPRRAPTLRAAGARPTATGTRAAPCAARRSRHRAGAWGGGDRRARRSGRDARSNPAASSDAYASPPRAASTRTSRSTIVRTAGSGHVPARSECRPFSGTARIPSSREAVAGARCRHRATGRPARRCGRRLVGARPPAPTRPGGPDASERARHRLGHVDPAGRSRARRTPAGNSPCAAASSRNALQPSASPGRGASGSSRSTAASALSAPSPSHGEDPRLEAVPVFVSMLLAGST